MSTESIELKPEQPIVVKSKRAYVKKTKLIIEETETPSLHISDPPIFQPSELSMDTPVIVKAKRVRKPKAIIIEVPIVEPIVETPRTPSPPRAISPPSQPIKRERSLKQLQAFESMIKAKNDKKKQLAELVFNEKEHARLVKEQAKVDAITEKIVTKIAKVKRAKKEPVEYNESPIVHTTIKEQSKYIFC